MVRQRQGRARVHDHGTAVPGRLAPARSAGGRRDVDRHRRLRLPLRARVSRLPARRRDDEDRYPRSALIVLATALMLALVVAAPLSQSAAVVTQIRVQGNVATSDEEVLRLAGVQAGMPVGDDTVAE